MDDACFLLMKGAIIITIDNLKNHMKFFTKRPKENKQDLFSEAYKRHAEHLDCDILNMIIEGFDYYEVQIGECPKRKFNRDLTPCGQYYKVGKEFYNSINL